MDFRPLLKSVNGLIEQRAGLLETALPGVIKNINDDGTIDVLPSIRANTQNGVVAKFDDKPILGVQLLKPGNQIFTVELTPQIGDRVLLVFFSRAARGWKEDGWNEEPSDPKAISGNNLDCAVAVQLSLKEAPNNIRIDKDGQIAITNQEAVYLEAKGDIELKSTEGKIKLSSDVVITGSLKVSQDVTAMSETAPVKLSTHIHPTAVGPTSPPTPNT